MSRYIWDAKRSKWVPSHEYRRPQPEQRSVLQFPQIMRPFPEHRSIVTGETISDRSQHREHLKAHGLEERGDEAPAFIEKRRYMRKHGATDKDIEAAERPEPAPLPDGILDVKWEDPHE